MEAVPALATHECWSLLRSCGLGRIGVPTPDGGVDIFPVNYVVDHGSIVFRTAEGTKLDLLTVAPSVCFEADDVDFDIGEAWSVVVRGPADAVTMRSDLFATFDLDVRPWQSGPKPVFVRVVAEAISGRRFPMAPTDKPSWRRLSPPLIG